MQQQTDLFILFPHHDESSSEEYYFLQSIELMDNSEFNDYINTFYDILKFINHEQYNGYYDASNLNAFLRPLKELGEADYPAQTRRLRRRINKWEKYNCAMLSENAFTLNGMPIEGNILCGIARELTDDAGYNHLVLNHCALVEKRLRVTCNDKSVQIELLPLDRHLIHQWFSSNRMPQRQYNDQYKKHGENGKGHWVNESSLLCSHQEAEQMLHEALGDADSKHLYFYDKKKQAILEFRFENTIAKSYHAFHTKDYTRVPKKVKIKIENLSDEKYW